MGDRYLGSVFRYFGKMKSEILIPNTELLNDYANYQIICGFFLPSTDTEY